MVTISNITGSELMKFSEISTSNGISRQIDVSSLPAGAYLITIVTPNGKVVERFIKQ